jgi:hypothetical protein
MYENIDFRETRDAADDVQGEDGACDFGFEDGVLR